MQYFKKANELEPDNAEIRRCLREAEGLEYNQRATLANTMGQPIPKQPIRRPQIKQPKFDPELLHVKISQVCNFRFFVFVFFSTQGPCQDDEWYKDSDNARGLAIFMQNSDVIWNFPKRLIDFLDDKVLVAAWAAACEKGMSRLFCMVSSLFPSLIRWVQCIPERIGTFLRTWTIL